MQSSAIRLLNCCCRPDPDLSDGHNLLTRLPMTTILFAVGVDNQNYRSDDDPIGHR
jgi:hypothetical protein